MNWYLSHPMWLKVIIGLPIYAFIGTMLWHPCLWVCRDVIGAKEEPEFGAGTMSALWPFTFLVGIPIACIVVLPIYIGVRFNQRVDENRDEKKRTKQQMEVAVAKARAVEKRKEDEKLSMVREALQIGPTTDQSISADYLARVVEEVKKGAKW